MSTTNLLKQLLNTNSLSMIWSGNDGFIINSFDKLIAFDLDLFNIERINKCSLDLELLAKKLSLLMITHSHEDHFSTETCKFLINNSECQFIIPKSCEEKANEIGIPNHRLQIVKPCNQYCICDIKFETVRAIHGHINGSVYSYSSTLDCGYIVSLFGKKIYQPGDTLLLEEHFNLSDIDVLFVSPTEHNTWIENSVMLINTINPKYIIAQHHSTYVEAPDNLFWSHGFIHEVYEKLNNMQKKQYYIPTEQEILFFKD